MSLKRAIYHIIFWIIFALIIPIWYEVPSTNYIDSLLSVLIGLPTFVLGVYFIVYYLIPNLLVRKRKYLLFFAAYLLSIVIITLHDTLVTRYICLPLFLPDSIHRFSSFMFDKKHIFRFLLTVQSQILFFISIKFLKDYLKSYFEKEQLKTKMVETELSLLKGQVHPHFLFNTLNNIYTLSLKGEKEQVTESLEKLSNFLHYTIYESKNKFISVEKEIDIIKNYIGIEKLRYSKLDLKISFPEHTDQLYFIPLIYFTFVENAFKHGTSKSIMDKWIDIKLEISNGDLFFTVKNSKSNKLQTDTLNYSKGIGLLNARKRLDLYLGKDNYKLEIKDQISLYEVKLQHKIIDNNDKMLNN